jgi:hypothetical protein
MTVQTGPLVPTLKGFDCADICDVSNWVPEADRVVSYWLTLHIGSPGNAAADLFQVRIANHAGFRGPAGNRASHSCTLLVEPYSWSAVLRGVDSLLANCAAERWVDVQDRLRKVFRWEFEGYR